MPSRRPYGAPVALMVLRQKQLHPPISGSCVPPGAPKAGQVGMEWPWRMSLLGLSSEKPGLRLL